MIALHAAFAIGAAILGAYILLTRKGTARHKAIGRVFGGLMLVVALIYFHPRNQSGALFADSFADTADHWLGDFWQLEYRTISPHKATRLSARPCHHHDHALFRRAGCRWSVHAGTGSLVSHADFWLKWHGISGVQIRGHCRADCAGQRSGETQPQIWWADCRHAGHHNTGLVVDAY